MKQKDKDKVEYVNFKSLSKEKQSKPSFLDSKHSNPLTNKLFKFVHNKLTGFKPEDFI